MKAMQQQQRMTVQPGSTNINFCEYDPTSASMKGQQENASTASTHHDGSRKVSAGVKRMDFYLVNGRHNARLGGNKLLELVIISQPHVANIQRAP